MRQPIITLLTDFGSQDYFVGAMKGVILSGNPAARIVDITHDIPPHDIQAGAFNLFATYEDFAARTIHVAVVDPGVGSERRPLLIECAEQYFVGPDNGIFSWICEREGGYRAISLTNQSFFRHPVSATFHGRDIFAPVAAAISTDVPLHEFGEEVDDIARLDSLATSTGANGAVEGRVIHIDRFGNCVTNFTRSQLDKAAIAAGAQLVIGRRQISSVRNFFADGSAQEGELFSLFGSAGFLEIAAQNSSAAAILDAKRGQPVTLILNRS